MNVKLNGVLAKGLQQRLQSEGEVISEVEYDLVLTSSFETIHTAKSKLVFVGHSPIPASLVDALGYKLVEGIPTLVAFRWFDSGSSDGWNSQTILGAPLATLMNDDLGLRCEMGMICRYGSSSCIDGLFNSNLLVNTLREMSYCGFISFSLGINSKSEVKMEVRSVAFGVPYFGVFNALEGVKGRMVEFFSGSVPVLLESWTTSLALSRSPFPYEMVGTKTHVGGVSPEVERHLTLLDSVRVKGSTFVTSGTLVGVSSAWAHEMSESVRRAVRTLRGVELPDKQYRTDGVSIAATSFHLAEDHGLI